MSKAKKCILALLAVLLVLELAAIVGVLGFIKPWTEAWNTMPDNGLIVLTRKEEGQVTLSWPAGKNQDRYLVQVLRGQQVLIQQWTKGTSCALPVMPEGEDLDIVISSARGYRVLLGEEERIRMGETALKATVDFKMPAIDGLVCTLDLETQTVDILFNLEENSVCRMYHWASDGNFIHLKSLEQGKVSLTLGEAAALPIPQGDEKLTFVFDAYRFSPGAVYYGYVTQQVSIVREDLLSRDLNLKCTDLGNNVYSFTWEETKGEYYELQQFDAVTETWRTLTRVELGQDRSYTTGHLEHYSGFRFRVVAVGGQTLPDSKYAAISEEVSITTGNTAIFTTVWPIQKLKLYKDTTRKEVIGEVKATKALCVLDEQKGMFRVRVGQLEGYIDSNYCLINLPEYLGDLCLYNIANSYASLFTAHEYEIPTVTGQVIVGYEQVQMSNGQQLVPLLYPVAKRLEKAAQSAISQGYKLTIYDAYRPRKATVALYDQAVFITNDPIPEKTYTGRVMTDLPKIKEGYALTYGEMMTDYGRYTMNYFLADGKSRHNRGIAVDLTLTDLATGKELKMQTVMHDLSWYSENSRDNKNAKKLASIMEGVGFDGLKSEWWHFHDLEAQDSLKPEYQKEGVSPECWMADDRGWRYRCSDGEYYVNCTATVEGVSCTFDEQGYLITD